MPALRVQTGSQKGQVFFLCPPGPLLFGRDLQADFPLFDPRVSRSHFSIEFCDEGYRLKDHGSKSGTYVNERRVTEAILLGSSRVRAGKTLFSFEPEEDPLVGREVGGYRLLERVGRGGMGIVYRSLQLSLQRVVALKVLSEELSRDPDFSRLFVREARAAAELSHPNIVRVYDVNILNGILFYAMEYMARGNVEDLCRRRGPLPIETAVALALEAARGLEFAQSRGVVHRDVKPGNLMVHQTGTLKIGDLGIARRVRDRDEPALLGGISGSPHYMSPEQALGREVDSRSDIYALGASLHQMVAGAPPFTARSLKELLFAHIRDPAPDLRDLRPGVPAPLAELVQEMLAKDPAHRPPSGALIAERLERLESQVRLCGVSLRGKRRRRRFVLLLSLLAVLFLSACIGFLLDR